MSKSLTAAQKYYETLTGRTYSLPDFSEEEHAFLDDVCRRALNSYR